MIFGIKDYIGLFEYKMIEWTLTFEKLSYIMASPSMTSTISSKPASIYHRVLARLNAVLIQSKNVCLLFVYTSLTKKAKFWKAE